MTLAAGDRLGRYEIMGPLGKGGMGEVYRALDRTLEREVAVKVLPEPVAADRERLERFEREAKAVARLAHPNILEIWDFGTDREISFAVTELLEGGTLREELAGGPLPWRKVRETAAAVADGLAAAHAKGIIHRDLKPENIFITADGRVKILDFGLARLAGPISSEAATGTLTPADTQRGVVLGTLGYISPEQLKGEPADARSDIFSLGCVLYEMLSGQRAFLRDSAVETMAAILREDPPRFAASGVAVGAELQRTVERCLEKRPERRFQSAADLAFALRSVVSDSDVPGVGASTATAAAVRPTAGGRRRVWVAVAVLVVVGVVAVAGVIGWRWLGGAKPAAVEAVVPSTQTPSPFITEWLVTVEPFENRSGDPSLEVAGRSLGDAVTEALGRVTQGLPSLPAVTVLAAPISGPPVVQPGELPPEGQGRLLVTGSYTVQGSSLEVVAQIRDRDGQRILYASEPVAVTRQLSRDSLEVLLRKLMGALGIHVATGIENASHLPDYPVAREFMVCQARKHTEGLAAPCEELDRALERDPEFLEPAYLGAIAAIQRRRPGEAVTYLEHVRRRSGRLTAYESAQLAMVSAWQQGDFGAALIAARSLQEIAPNRFLGAAYRGLFAAALNRPAEVIQTVESVLRSVPRTAVRTRRGGEVILLEAYRALGEHDKMLVLARQIRRESPGTTAGFVNEARALAALGRLDELDALIEECRSTLGAECDTPKVRTEASWYLAAYGHREQALAYAGRAADEYQAMSEQEVDGDKARYLLYALRAAERWDEYGAFAARCVHDKPADPEQPWFRSCVGMAAAHRGDRGTAAAILNQLEAEGHHRPAAYVAAHLGERDRAVELLRRSLAEASSTYSSLVMCDLDLQPVWDYPPFRELIRPRG
jgi:tetratricopeptide (TPR) repeat protein/TolB-like protein